MGKMIPLVKPNIPPKDILLPELEKTIYSGYIAQGEKVDEFEERFKKLIGGGYSLSVNSGTAALHIALILAKVKPGTEVISTPLTAEPTNVAIKMAGAKIRYADIDYNTGTIDSESIESKINKNTSAIMIVDYAGIPCNFSRIKELSKTYNIPVIHDAAHSLGAKFDGINCGMHFPYTVFSFQAIKHLTTIDGGILHLQNREDHNQGKLIRWFGIDKRKTRLENNITIQGYKYHMNNVNATFGIVQLESIQSVINKYIENGQYYDEHLKNIFGVELLNYYPNSIPSYWLYTLKVENREGFIKKLTEQGISASELHKRNDSHKYLNDFNEKLPMMDKFIKKLVHIPCGWWVDENDRENIVNTIKSGW